MLISILTVNFRQYRSSVKKAFICSLPLTLIVLIAVFFPFNRMENTYLKKSAERYMKAADEKRVAYSEGLTETVQYLQKDFFGKALYQRMLTNNYSMSSNQYNARRYMKLYVYMPVAIRNNPENALLICFGVGSTAKALSDTACLKEIDIVDISKNVIDMSSVIFPDDENNPIHDPRTNVFIEDGRFFLLTADKQYGIITAEPPPPKVNGVVNLYTKEYFELIYDRLKNGGVATYWLPVYQLKVEETQAILKAFTDVFENTTLWTAAGYEWMMMGVKEPDSVVDTNYFEKQWQNPVVASELISLGFLNPDQLGSLFIADGERIKEWIGKIPPLMDNYPQRLDYDDKNWRENLAEYANFMSPDISRQNFYTSQKIKQIWPQEMIEESLKYFTVRQVVNEMLSVKSMQQMNPIEILHLAITNQLLQPYIALALGSCQDAQEIIAEHDDGTIDPFEEAESYKHFAAHALQKFDFKGAEKIYEKARNQLCSEGSDADYLYFDVFRIYFFLSAGERDEAENVMNNYIHMDDDEIRIRNRKENIDKWWSYLQSLF